MKFTKADRTAWVEWLKDYGRVAFYDAFMANAQFAKSTCVHCGEDIYLDIAEGGGVPDWRNKDGDYGCFMSTDDIPKDGIGSHMPERLKFTVED